MLEMITIRNFEKYCRFENVNRSKTSNDTDFEKSKASKKSGMYTWYIYVQM